MSLPTLCTKLFVVAVMVFVTMPTARGAPIRMLPLGDSITRGPTSPTGWDGQSWGAYRGMLKQMLTDAGLDTNMVGSQSLGDFGDDQHEGHGGFRVDQLASGVNTWLTANSPDIILLMAGTNGVRWRHDDPADYAAELDDLVGRIFNHMVGDVHISLASIPPMLANDQHVLNNWKVEVYNSHIPGIVQKYREAGQRISFVDVHSVLDPATDMWSDGVHPTRAGFEKIARVFAADVTLTVPEPSAFVVAVLGLLVMTHAYRTRDGVGFQID